MSLFTKQIEHGKFVIVVRRGHNARFDFDKARYRRVLNGLYGSPMAEIPASAFSVKNEGSPQSSVEIDLKALIDPDVQDALTMHNYVDAWSDLAAHVVKFEGMDWPQPKSNKDKIDKAFCDYLDNAEMLDGKITLDPESVWQAIKATIDELDRPNGAAGSPADTLTEAERDDPFLQMSERYGTPSANGHIKTQPIAPAEK